MQPQEGHGIDDKREFGVQDSHKDVARMLGE